MSNTVSAIAGLLVPVVFWSTLAACGAKTAGYKHLTHLVSELGAEGSKTRQMFTFGLVLSSLLSLILVVGLLSLCREVGLSTLPVYLILTFSISIAGAAIIPLPSRWHGIIGSPSMAFFLSPLLAGILWREIEGLITFSLLSLLAILMGCLVFFPRILSRYRGLKQRFFHVGWSIWFIYLSVVLLK